MQTKGLCYQKTGGAATTLGQKYEFGLSALVYLRLLASKLPFLLGSNMAGLGAFDDIFVKLDTGATCCIQLKHKEHAAIITKNALTDKKGKFSLLKYYESYCEIENAIKGVEHGKNNEIIKDVDFDNVSFILYTNSPVEHTSVHKTVDELSDLENLLSTGDSNQTIFSFGCQDSEIWQLGIHTGDRNRYRKFLSKLKIFSCQCSATQIFKLVELEVANCARVGIHGARTLSSDLLMLTEKWWEQENYFLSKNSPLWHTLLREQINLQIKQQLDRIQYKFRPNKGIFANTNFKRDMYLNVIVSDVDEDIRCLNVWSQVQEEFGQCCLIMNSYDALERFEQVKNICKSGFCETLVINMNKLSHFPHILRHLEPELMRIVLISDSKLLHPKCYAIADVWHIKDLIQESQDQILENIIEFQGHEMTLSNLNNNVIQAMLSGESLATLMKGLKLSISNPLPAVDELYIKRSLYHPTVLSSQVLHVLHKDDIFAVSQFPHQQFRELCSSTIILSSVHHSNVLHLDHKKYLELCKRWKEMKNIHWVVFEGDFLTWKQSYGSQKTIFPYIDAMSKSCQNYSPGCFHTDIIPEDWKKKLRLITGQPGMGKSTLLKYLAVNEKQRQPNTWVLLVPLNNCTSYLQKMSMENITADQVLDMLFSTSLDGPFCPQLSKELLNQSLKITGNLSIFLDAVDEVSPTYKELIVKIIKFMLQNTKLYQLCVTSRTVLERYLVDELSTLPLVLQPFTNKQQVDFLKEYLVHQGFDQNSDTIADVLIQQYKTSEQHLYDVPLHAQLAADMFLKVYRESPNLALENTFTSINLHEMYENFFVMKQALCFRRYNLDPTSVAVVDHKLFNIFMDKYIACALLVIFSDDQLKQLNITNLKTRVQEFLEDIEQQRIGIIESVHDGRPHFVHVSFAEYLVALWFKQKYESNVVMEDERAVGVLMIIYNKIIEMYRYIFGMVMGTVNIYILMLDCELDSIRLFFDHMMAGKCILHQAVLRGDLVNLKKLLEDGVHIGSLDCGGRLALHLAACYGKAEIVKLLIKFGCMLNVTDNILNWRPLRYADYVREWEVVVILLKYESKEADLFHMNSAIQQKLIIESIKAAAQADNEDTCRVFNNTGFDLPQFNTRIALHLVIAAGNIQLLEKLLKLKDNILGSTAPGFEQHSPLHEAAECSQLEAAVILLNHKVDVNVKDNFGSIALHISSRKGDIHMVHLLLDKGSNIRAVDNTGCTPLHLAALKGHYDTVYELLQRNAPVDAQDDSQWTPLLRAAWQGHFNVVKLLLEHGGNIEAIDDSLKTALHRAAWEGQVEAVGILLDNSANIEARDRENVTPLLEAASEGHSEIVRLLLKRGANREALSSRNRTALHRAAFTGHIAAVEVLLEYNADMGVRDDSGRTPLHLAASKGHSDIVYLLLSKGSNTEIRDNLGWTALHRAAYYGHLNVVSMLMENGANLAANDNSGNSPLDIAVQYKKSQVVHLLSGIKPQD